MDDGQHGRGRFQQDRGRGRGRPARPERRAQRFAAYRGAVDDQGGGRADRPQAGAGLAAHGAGGACGLCGRAGADPRGGGAAAADAACGAVAALGPAQMDMGAGQRRSGAGGGHDRAGGAVAGGAGGGPCHLRGAGAAGGLPGGLFGLLQGDPGQDGVAVPARCGDRAGGVGLLCRCAGFCRAADPGAGAKRGAGHCRDCPGRPVLGGCRPAVHHPGGGKERDRRRYHCPFRGAQGRPGAVAFHHHAGAAGVDGTGAALSGGPVRGEHAGQARRPCAGLGAGLAGQLLCLGAACGSLQPPGSDVLGPSRGCCHGRWGWRGSGWRCRWCFLS